MEGQGEMGRQQNGQAGRETLFYLLTSSGHLNYCGTGSLTCNLDVKVGV